ncbi:DUF1801 domain-containing protein [Parasalinivibrio latis]|uniref:DUF1801 domain-containing protein n=1 Tax=Parasalinivibrio latis TaxID=2952610 RepID=UPI0030E3DD62
MTESEALEKISQYPKPAGLLLLSIRQLIFEVADSDGVGQVEESLKWGELSYSVKGGSPVRIAWSEKKPDSVSVYFVCTTSLVETFREIYAELFIFHGNREIEIPMDKPVQFEPLAHCFSLAFHYKSLRHLPLLGT